MTVPTYDYNKRDWKKIYGPEELNKIGELLTGVSPDDIITNNKPTVMIQKRPSTLKAASIQNDNRSKADKVLRLLTGNI
jgi:hypothetical protein